DVRVDGRLNHQAIAPDEHRSRDTHEMNEPRAKLRVQSTNVDARRDSVNTPLPRRDVDAIAIFNAPGLDLCAPRASRWSDGCQPLRIVDRKGGVWRPVGVVGEGAYERLARGGKRAARHHMKSDLPNGHYYSRISARR